MEYQMEKDRIFAGKKGKPEPFQFNREVARVFDDMLNRSVPLYGESIRRQAEITSAYYQEKSRIYDLGCSNGNLGLLILDQMKGREFSLIGVDSSFPMIEKYNRQLVHKTEASSVCIICGFLEDIRIKNASVVLINLTLQFIAPQKRDAVIASVFNGLNSGGILLLTEKTVHRDKVLSDLEIRFYKKFKLENGYSELEISRKREALEKVLVPDTIETHRKRLERAGFKTMDVWLKWFNFASFIAVKP
ncbi:MAG: carboxy-S-adenosyl-L-methionine synthase CmoA [Desulfobacula sp. RIFOXYA12_FULL_46_16]|nr:MAG: carboxy-S-adenosyl-L-methionine synthase CmoA [Deltaproteobacteria bacterium RIFOXYC2_FULL_48_10]OGR21135.1 MAG: carboxy-S-adenosyl-L-methionine synthase CmoA [Desulfobacula sp. RIFOXYA12_FULL_46_16]OGR58798.1 MAG: carboxy-S-adenosyl-L-methionine synthase CmoA [Desulfobacula sp. RIFOXYB2_FULL_45_6]